MDRIKRLLRRDETAPAAANVFPGESHEKPSAAAVWERHSHGLAEFSGALEPRTGLNLLDFGELLQANVTYLTSFGHKLYSVALWRDMAANPSLYSEDSEEQNEARLKLFLNSNLNYPNDHFDGVLLWDALEFLPSLLMKAAVERLHRVMKPGGCMLAVFHAEEKASEVPVYSYRIASADTLQLEIKFLRRPARHFNNRAIEKMFQQFHSVKFFLTRDNLREVIVRR